MDGCPPASPDSNAIESACSWMNRYAEKNQSNSQQRLKRLVEQAGHVIAQNIIHGYINNTTNICTQILASNGCKAQDD